MENELDDTINNLTWMMDKLKEFTEVSVYE